MPAGIDYYCYTRHSGHTLGITQSDSEDHAFKQKAKVLMSLYYYALLVRATFCGMVASAFGEWEPHFWVKVNFN